VWGLGCGVRDQGLKAGDGIQRFGSWVIGGRGHGQVSDFRVLGFSFRVLLPEEAAGDEA
jgi:hypothetical protein